MLTENINIKAYFGYVKMTFYVEFRRYYFVPEIDTQSRKYRPTLKHPNYVAKIPV